MQNLRRLLVYLGVPFYFPSGRYGDFPDLSRRDVAKLIKDFCNRDFEDFSEAAFYEFISNTPQINWMIEVSEELNQIDDAQLTATGETGLMTEKGQGEARKVADRLIL